MKDTSYDVKGDCIARVETSIRSSYDIYFARDLSQHITRVIEGFDKVSKVLIISDSNVYSLHVLTMLALLRASVNEVISFVIQPGRRQKSLQTVSEILQFLFNHGADRYTLVLNVGGGTVGDIGGFISALYMRGLRYIHVPTTLLSQSDSSIGGKVSVNFGQYLNGLGVFYPPVAVLTDPNLLTTLPQEEYRSGLAEIVKYAVVLDIELFEHLEQNIDLMYDSKQVEPILVRSIKSKCKMISEDPLEKGLFQLYNYGHEIGRAIEVAYDYHHLRHGEAVSIGMQAAAWLGVQSGLTDTSVLRRQRLLLSKLDLPTNIPAYLRKDQDPKMLAKKIETLLQKEKNRYLQNILWVVPMKLGEAVHNVTFEWALISECIKQLSEGSLE